MKVLRRIRDAYRRHEIGTVVTGLITLLVIVFLWPYIVIVVPAVGPEYSPTIVSPEVGTAVPIVPASLNRKSFTTGASQPFRSKSSWWPASASATIS